MQITTPDTRRAPGRSPLLARLAPPAMALTAALAGWVATAAAGDRTPAPIDFNREIRPILSNTCFQCHGPDPKARKGVSKPYRLDNEAGAFADCDGGPAIVRGNPDESDLIARINSTDPLDVMPPRSTGKALSANEKALLVEWVKQGAPYAKHWSYTPPVRPPLPAVKNQAWPRNAIDAFILKRLEAEGLKPSAEADRSALIRRVTLDLTGLPPTLEEVDRFVRDDRPDAYDRLVDRLLESQAYGEHWARMWLDLARYADSAGYADDPPRTIWAYRDYVIRSLNANKPFDQFTIEQIAGDLLPNPTDDQLIATALHRNTLTNNEGGTNDEEFRNVAVVDRVNTTMAVWMGTTIACAQCHDHKYDPLTQEEFFRVFAFFNNTEDADRGDESPLLPVFSADQKRQKADWIHEAETLEATLRTPTPALLAGVERWEGSLSREPSWRVLAPQGARTRGGVATTILPDHSVRIPAGSATDVTTVELPLEGPRLSAVRLEAMVDESLPGRGPGHASGNFVVTHVAASILPPKDQRPSGRYIRVELPGPGKILSLAEVEVFRGGENVARAGVARQSSTDFDGQPGRAIDGRTDGRYEANSTTHTAISESPWWEVDLKAVTPIDRIAIWNRTDNGVQERLAGARVLVLGEDRQPVLSRTIAEAPKTSTTLALGGPEPIAFAAAFADYHQPGFEPSNVLAAAGKGEKGWAVGGQTGQPHTLTLVPAAPLAIAPGSTLTVTVEQLYKQANHTLGRLRFAATGDEDAGRLARLPARVLALLRTDRTQRTAAERNELATYYVAEVAPELEGARKRLAVVRKSLADLKPSTTVPIQRQLAAGARRTTKIQHRGNFLDLGGAVTEGVPAVFPPLPDGAAKDRLALAKWLVDDRNPLTPRVIANRYWEQLFGIGIVPSSEEFGTQGELPSHPELLDWLATELRREGWDLKRFLKLLVTSATYRQDSLVTPESLERDPENRLLARGPRFRLSAETIRDQALAVGGLLSARSYGPPVKPPQPTTGLSAAFGGGIDWQTSAGDDRYRRGLYTSWRRSNPYPSMAAFDAPNREVCTLRRTRTNTPLQALVTLNDPVYIEAAQGLARRIDRQPGTVAEKVAYGFRVCLARPPSTAELERLVRLYETTREALAADPGKASRLATDPLGPAPAGADLPALASWTVVGNVLLNVDEMLMKR